MTPRGEIIRLVPHLICSSVSEQHSVSKNIHDLYEYGRFLILRRPRNPLNIEYESLREITRDAIPTDTLDDRALAPLRLGR